MNAEQIRKLADKLDDREWLGASVDSAIEVLRACADLLEGCYDGIKANSKVIAAVAKLGAIRG